MIEYTKGGIRSYKSKNDRQCNGRKKKEKKDKQRLQTQQTRSLQKKRVCTRVLLMCKQFLLHYWHPKHKSIKRTTFGFIFVFIHVKQTCFILPQITSTAIFVILMTIAFYCRFTTRLQT